MPPTDSPNGLDPALAAQRLRDEGPNELGISQRRTLRDMAWDVVTEPMFLLLLGAGAIYLAMGDAHEALILLGFVVIIMAITVLQERRTDNARNARARGLERSRRAFSALSVRRSCSTVIVMMMTTKPSRIIASCASPMAR